MFISEQIETICKNPIEGEIAVIIIQAKERKQQTTVSYIKNQGGDIEETGPSNLIKATVPEQNIEDLCGKEFIQAVESPEDAIHL